MIDIEQLKATAFDALAKQGFRNVEFINSEYLSGQPEQPFLLPEPPHWVFRFWNCELVNDSTIEDGDTLLCVKIDEMSLVASVVSTF